MALPDITIQRLLEAGVHFGHQTHRWNPKMKTYIYGTRNNVHIFDLTQTVPMMHQALKLVSDTVASGGRVLFVGTKRQASQIIAENARQCAQYYVNHRWLGGMLTNWNTISDSIKRLRNLEETDDATLAGLTKKERLQRSREHEKLELALGGIKDMGGIPDLLFVVDTNKEAIAIQEAKRLGIPVVAIVDSNCDPSNIDLPVPGNDDASRAISLYCELVSSAVIDGISRSRDGAGIDLGASAEVPVEPALADAAASDEASNTDEAATGSNSKADAADAGKDAAADAGADKKDAAASDEAKSDKAASADKSKSADSSAKADKEDSSAKADKADKASADASDSDAEKEFDPKDLTAINGIGPISMEKLNSLGILVVADIAGLSEKDVEAHAETIKIKPEWIEEAKSLG